MTPKENAEELIEKMLGANDQDYSTSLSIKSASICVDEILDLDSIDKDYWQEVKSEIEKIFKKYE